MLGSYLPWATARQGLGTRPSQGDHKVQQAVSAPQSRSHGQVPLRLPQLAATAREMVGCLGDKLTAEGPLGAPGTSWQASPSPSSVPCRLALMQPPSWPVGPGRGGRAARWSSHGPRQSRRRPPAPYRSSLPCYWAEESHRQPLHPSGILATPASRSILQLPPSSASTPLSWAPCILPSAQNGFTRTRLGRSFPSQILCPQEGTRLPGSWPTLRPAGPAPTATPVLDKLCRLPGTPSHWVLSAEGHPTTQDQLRVFSWASHSDTSRQVNHSALTSHRGPRPNMEPLQEPPWSQRSLTGPCCVQ